MKIKFWRQNANHRKRPPIHLHLAANHIIIPAKPVLPDPIADERDMSVFCIFFIGEYPSSHRLHPQQRQHFAAHSLRVYLFAAMAVTKSDMEINETTDVFKRR